MTGRPGDGFVEEVRAAANIATIVSAYVPLKKVGNSQKGLCPFHSEKTPSFNVNEARGVFHCFGCGEGGDVFKFVMLYDKVSFPEALRKVAELSGVPLPAAQRGAEDQRRERLFALNEKALEVYRHTLRGSRGAAGRAYLDKRGLSQEMVDAFELGVTPEGWEGVTAPLLRAGFKPEELLAVGLSKERAQGKGLYDRFHERLLFPIRSASGRLVGFGGRSLSGQEPKYLNSPETEIYSKSEVLYGLNLAKDGMRRAGAAILVEGYLDLIALHQAGFPETVASLGTSLTERHARLLARFVKKVYVSYDGDKAGRNAAKRAIGVLLRERIEVAVVEIEAGQDPDDLIRAKGPQAYRELLQRAEGFVPFLLRLAREGEGSGPSGDSPEARVRRINEVLPLLALVPDPIERAMHANRLAEGAQVEDQVLLAALRKAAEDQKEQVAAPPAGSGRPTFSEAEAVFVAALLGEAELGQWLLEQSAGEIFDGLAAGAVLAAVRRSLERGEEVTPARLNDLVETAPARALLGRVLIGAEPAPTSEQALAALNTLRERRLRRELQDVQARIPRVPPDELDSLLQRKQELSRALDSLRRS